MIGHPNLLAWYRLQDSIADSSGNGRNGSSARNTNYIAAVFGKGNNFYNGGSTSDIVLPTSFTGIAGDNNYTVCSHVKPNNLTDYMRVFNLYTDNNSNINCDLFGGKGNLVQYDAGVFDSNTQGATSLSTSVYNHLAWQRSSLQKYVFFNGAQDAYENINKTITGTIANVKIGITASVDLYQFKGTLDDVQIYNYALPPSDIKRVMLGLHPLTRS